MIWLKATSLHLSHASIGVQSTVSLRLCTAGSLKKIDVEKRRSFDREAAVRKQAIACRCLRFASSSI